MTDIGTPPWLECDQLELLLELEREMGLVVPKYRKPGKVDNAR